MAEHQTPEERLLDAVMSLPAPVQATAVDGRVLIDVDSATARDLAGAFSTAYANCEDLEAERPGWFGDVVAMVTAAAQAELQAGEGPEVVEVPLVTPGAPRLTLVAGGEPAC